MPNFVLTFHLLCGIFFLIHAAEDNCCTVAKLPQFKVDKGVQYGRNVCDDEVITYRRIKKKAVLDGLQMIKLKCNRMKRTWEQYVGDDADYENVQFHMLGRDIREPVNSHELHLRCEIYVQHQDRPLPVLFSWTTDEDGILKRIPLYNDRNSVPHGVGKYAWKVSPTESELVIEQVREADLKLYSCWVSIGNEVKSQNVTLIKKNCERLSMPDDGKFHERKIGLHPGSKATPVCSDGFARVSQDIQYLLCTLWGEWAAVDRETKQLKNVDWEYDKRHAMCKHTCKREAVPKGDEYPIEKSISSLPPHIEMKDQSIVWPNTNFTYTCPENYALIGQNTRMCTESGSYTAEIPKCKALVGCHDYCRAFSVNYGVVKYIPKRAVRIGKHMVTDTCKAVIRCTNGYKLKKNLTLFCDKKLKDSQWAEKSGHTLFDPPTCLPESQT